MRISDWSSDVCSSDLYGYRWAWVQALPPGFLCRVPSPGWHGSPHLSPSPRYHFCCRRECGRAASSCSLAFWERSDAVLCGRRLRLCPILSWRSEEHTSELQSLMRISYAVFCLKKKRLTTNGHHTQHKTY